MFSHADVASVSIIKEVLETFTTQSGLSINNAKSSLFLSGVNEATKEDIKSMLGFNPMAPPVTYLGVPLLTKRLTKSDCVLLLDKITARIKLWTTASLSYAGRLQLIKSTLFSM